MTNYRGVHLFTSESVTEGHPDKVCDQISDAILDAYLAQDALAHVAVETCAAADTFMIFGEISSSAVVDVEKVVRRVLSSIGYTDSSLGTNSETVAIDVHLIQQSPEINQGVNRSSGIANFSKADKYQLQGAGDQGLMFGYATDETESFMPLPIILAHRIAQRLATVRHEGTVPHLRPDGKTQVTVAYDDNNIPVRIDTVVVSTQHDSDVSQECIKTAVHDNVIQPVLDDICGDKVLHNDYRLLVNPTGSFVIGGPAADSGLTGRKIIVDTYGGAGHHGGGAFSGKDPSKVDRSAAYAARWVAKNVVAAGLAHRVEVQIAYAIGVANPVSVYVDTFGTEKYPREVIEQAVRQVYDLRPAAIIDDLGLLSPMYSKTAVYGHFGRDEFPWERVDKAEQLASCVSDLLNE